MPTSYASYSDTITKRQRYETLRGQLWNERSSFDATNREIAKYYRPVRPRFVLTDRTRGDRRNQDIYDETGVTSANTLRAGMHAGMTSPARPWMQLSLPDAELSKYGPVKQWLYDVADILRQQFQISNLYKSLPQVYDDMAVFGTGAMGVLENPGNVGRRRDLFRCYTYPTGAYAFGLDNRELATTFVLEYSKTVSQLVEEFGGEEGRPLERKQEPDWSRFSPSVKNFWDRGDYETAVDICWIVNPQRDYDDQAIGYRSFPWASCHFEKGRSDAGAQGFLRESGFEEFPILAPRWYAGAQETYATDYPGLQALGAVKQLQIMAKREGQAIAKMVNPPVFASSELRTQKVSLIEGDITYGSNFERGGVRPIHEVKPDLSHFVLSKQDTRARVREIFFVDLIRMLSLNDPGTNPDMTAREIQERHEEKFMVLSPVIESTDDELRDPLVDRVFAMAERAGMLPEPPEEIVGMPLKVEYISIFSQAQKMLGIAPQERFIGTIGALVQNFPDVRHKVNLFAFLDDYADNLGLNPEQIRPTDEAEARAAQEQQAMQQQAEADTMLKGAQAAKHLGTTPMSGDTALNAIVQGATAA